MIINNLYDTIIKCKNKGLVDNAFTIKISLIDYEDEYVVGKNFPVTLIDPSGTSTELHNGIGGEPMDYVLQFTPTVQGLYTVICNHTKKQFYIDGLKVHRVSDKIFLFYTETKVILTINGTINSSKGNFVKVGDVPSTLSPVGVIYFKGYTKNSDFRVNGAGEIHYRNWESTGNVTENIQASWSKKI